MLVFSYGSNLHIPDLNRYAEDKGLPAPRLHFVGRAWLPDHRLAFGYHSASRGGGALDLVPEVGFAVAPPTAVMART